MPEVNITVKPEPFGNIPSAIWDQLVLAFKRRTSQCINERLDKGQFAMEDIIVFWSLKDGCEDAPELLAKVDMSTGEGAGFNLSYRDCRRIADDLASWLQRTPFTRHLRKKVAVWVRSYYNAAYATAVVLQE